jgi:hypothetical protein
MHLEGLKKITKDLSLWAEIQIRDLTVIKLESYQLNRDVWSACLYLIPEENSYMA